MSEKVRKKIKYTVKVIVVKQTFDVQNVTYRNERHIGSTVVNYIELYLKLNSIHKDLMGFQHLSSCVSTVGPSNRISWINNQLLPIFPQLTDYSSSRIFESETHRLRQTFQRWVFPVFVLSTVSIEVSHCPVIWNTKYWQKDIKLGGSRQVVLPK